MKGLKVDFEAIRSGQLGRIAPDPDETYEDAVKGMEPDEVGLMMTFFQFGTLRAEAITNRGRYTFHMGCAARGEIADLKLHYLKQSEL